MDEIAPLEEKPLDLDEELEDSSFVEKTMMKGMLKKLQAGGRQTQKLMLALKDLGYATRWSQDSIKEYWDVKADKPKENADYDKAEKMLNKGIEIMDKVLADFPTTVSSVLPIKKKLLVQLCEIRHLRVGELKPYEEYEKEVTMTTGIQ